MSFNRSLFDKMQNSFQDVFTPRAVYDGKKIAFASHELDLGMSDKRQVCFPYPRCALIIISF